MDSSSSRGRGGSRARRSLLGSVALLGLSAFGTLPAQAADPLADGFRTPPQAARPYVWWHWINGNISSEGAALDLDWMKRIGLGGVHVFSGSVQEPVVVPQPSRFMSPGWTSVFQRALGEARSAGMHVGIAGSPGWSETGGVWVAPEDGMKKYVWSETQVQGGRRFDGQLRTPPTTVGTFQGFKRIDRRNAVELKGDVYRDTLVVAFPTPAADSAALAPSYVSSAGPLDLSALAAGDLAASVEVPVAAGERSAFVDVVFPKAVTAGSLTLGTNARTLVEIQASEDGRTFRTVRRADTANEGGVEKPAPQQTLAFAPTRARVFRVVLSAPPPEPPVPGLPAGMGASARAPKSFVITRLSVNQGARLDRFEAKAGFQSALGDGPAEAPPAVEGGVVGKAGVLDLTSRLRADGRLDWTPPPGRWTVLRFGWSLTGQTNHPAETEATGLEVDKLDASAVRRYMENYLRLYEGTAGAKLGPDGVQELVTDSWEAGSQTWSPGLLDEFRKRRGYDPLPYLPVLAGRVVDGVEASDRFLWDFRLTLKELLADNHYGVLAEVLHAHGMSYYTEANGDLPRALGDGLAMKARSDVPTAEYWARPWTAGPGQPALKADMEEAASAAHLYGKPLVAAESLTFATLTDPWSFSPRALKPVADEIFARGVNRILLHESHHQPLVSEKPGLALWIFGQYFNRNETWAEQAGPWVQYLARTSYMLQQGRYAADVAYFYGEERNLTEVFRRNFDTRVPDGYGYDFVNAEAILNLLSVRDGRLVTPSGMSYRLLFIPSPVTRMSLPTLQKLRDLVAAGAVVVGPKPEGGLGLASPDAEVRALAEQLWGQGQGSPQGHAYGKGRVYSGADLAGALRAEQVAPDVEFAGRSSGAQLLTLHRKTEDADIYFISNQGEAAETLEATFRVAGRRPELWRADAGTVEALSYRLSGDRVTAPLRLEPHDAVFVVLRSPASGPAWTAPEVRTVGETVLKGPWTLTFEPGRGAPEKVAFPELKSWTEAAEPGVKYFSGHAIYRQTLTLPADWTKGGRRTLLDLGEVRELATVSVNGQRLETLWHAPYRLDITRAVRPGRNLLEIEVVNLWPNRLIGDKQPGAKPVAFAPQSPYRADSALLPSGLLGPVKVVAQAAR